MTSKYPFIPREYYPAVMFAAKIVREDGTFNRAVEIASEYYGVDPEEVEKHLRARQAAGQKGKKRGSFSWYVIPYAVYEEDRFIVTVDDEIRSGRKPSIGVIKATSIKNAKKQIEKHWDWFRYGFSYGDIKTFQSKLEADNYVKEAWA